MSGPASTWRERVHELAPDAHDRMVEYLGEVVGKSPYSAKQTELMILATSTAVRYRPSMVTHATRAVAEGATDDDLFTAVAIAALSAGFTSMIEGVDVIDEVRSQTDGE